MACGPVSVSCHPTAHQTDSNSFSSIFSPNAKIFHHFYQLFIIFTNITINNTYIQVITTPIFHFHRADCWNVLCPCLGGGPGTAWSLGPGRPGPSGHRVVPCSGRAKSPGHGPGHRDVGCMAIYKCNAHQWRSMRYNQGGKLQ